MTKIKVCGLTKKEEAGFLNRNQVDFAGFVVFFPKSRRNVPVETACEIIRALEPGIKSVAVTVSPSIEEALEIRKAGFDYIQIHGEIKDGVLDAVCIPVLRAFNISNIDEYMEFQEDDRIAGFVFDAAEPGSGKTFDWSMIEDIPKNDKIWLLAGGLTPENVAEAVLSVEPYGVDVSSGVECDDTPGKDGDKVDRFVQNVRDAACRCGSVSE